MELWAPKWSYGPLFIAGFLGPSCNDRMIFCLYNRFGPSRNEWSRSSPPSCIVQQLIHHMIVMSGQAVGNWLAGHLAGNQIFETFFAK